MFRSFNFICFLSLCFVFSYSSAVARDHGHHRRILHQPFFPRESVPSAQPPGSSPQPQPSPKQQPKLPFSSGSSSSSSPSAKPFFPSFHYPPPPPSPVPLTTLPANISSLLLPQSSSSSHHHPIIAVALSVSLFSAALVAALTAFVLYRRHRKYTISDKASRSDSLRLYPPNTATSDGSRKPRGGTPSSTSSEFLYLGTVANSRDDTNDKTVANSSNATSAPQPLIQYQKLGSPELKPLPPLPRHNFRQSSTNANEEDDDEEEFFSPRGSSGRKPSPPQQLTGSSSRGVFQLEADKFGSRSFNSRTPSYPCSNSASPSNSVSITSSPPLNFSSRNLKPRSPDTMLDFPIPSRPFTQQQRSASTSSSTSSVSSPMENVSSNAQNSPEITWDISGQGKTLPATIPVKLPPPPPPPPPPRFWEIPVTAPSMNVESENLKQVSSAADQLQHGVIENPKPKLKALHWDKVRASSDRAMVWDQIKPSSFQ